MKKFLALLLAGILCFALCACGEESTKNVWSIKQTVDEFGDVTEDSADVIAGTFTGKFSNTATPESDLTVAVHFGRKASFNHYIAGFDLKEYNSTNATFLSSDIKQFKMKLNEEIITLSLTGNAPNGTLYLGTEDYGWSGDLLFNELIKGNDVRCIITIGSSEYNFTLTSDNFSSLCEENGFKEGATELTFKEAVNIFLDDTGEYISGAQKTIIDKFEKLEVMDDAAIKSDLNGRFLRISVSSYMPVGDYAFPHWQGVNILTTEGKTCTADYDADTDYGIEKNISKGLFLNGYKEYRSNSGFFTKPTRKNLSIKNNLLTFKYEKSDLSYQCRKITDNIYLLCYNNDDGSFSPTALLFSCDNFFSLLEAVETAKESLNQIDAYL